MSDVTAFNNCMSVFWQQHEAELSVFWHQGQAIGSRQPICFRKSSCAPGPVQTASVKWRTRGLAVPDGEESADG